MIVGFWSATCKDDGALLISYYVLVAYWHYVDLRLHSASITLLHRRKIEKYQGMGENTVF